MGVLLYIWLKFGIIIYQNQRLFVMRKANKTWKTRKPSFSFHFSDVVGWKTHKAHWCRVDIVKHFGNKFFTRHTHKNMNLIAFKAVYYMFAYTSVSKLEIRMLIYCFQLHFCNNNELRDVLNYFAFFII